MTSSLFPRRSAGNSILSAVNALRSMSGGDPQAAYDRMYATDPGFRSFADSMRGKTPEQAFRENGMDFDQVRSIIG